MFRGLDRSFVRDFVKEYNERLERYVIEHVLPLRRRTSLDELLANGWKIAVLRDDLGGDLERMFGSGNQLRFGDFRDFCQRAIKGYVSPDEIDWTSVTSVKWAYRLNSLGNGVEEMTIHSYPTGGGGYEMFLLPSHFMLADDMRAIVAKSMSPHRWKDLRNLFGLLGVRFDEEAFEKVLRLSEDAQRERGLSLATVPDHGEQVVVQPASS